MEIKVTDTTLRSIGQAFTYGYLLYVAITIVSALIGWLIWRRYSKKFDEKYFSDPFFKRDKDRWL